MGINHSFPTPSEQDFCVPHELPDNLPPLSTEPTKGTSSTASGCRFSLSNKTWWTDYSGVSAKKSTCVVVEELKVKLVVPDNDKTKCLVYQNGDNDDDSETLLAVLQQTNHRPNRKIQICVLAPPTPEARKVETYNGHALYEYATVVKAPSSKKQYILQVLGDSCTFRTAKCGKIGGPGDRVIYYYPNDAAVKPKTKKSSAVVCAHVQDKPHRRWGIRTRVDPLLMLLFMVGTSRLDYLLEEFVRSMSFDSDYKLVL